MEFNKTQKSLILASASPRREQLLKQVGLLFEVVPSDYDEGTPQEPAEQFVLETAKRKAQTVIAKSALKQGLVVAADTVVVVEQHIFGKPNDQQDAKKMLTLLSGKAHHVLTGMVVGDLSNDRCEQWVEDTKVYMRPINQHELETYLASEAWVGKAGAYGIQGCAAAFVTRVEGCYFNVVGLPIARLVQTLDQLGLYL